MLLDYLIEDAKSKNKTLEKFGSFVLRLAISLSIFEFLLAIACDPGEDDTVLFSDPFLLCK